MRSTRGRRQYSMNLLVGADFNAHVDTAKLGGIETHFIALSPAIKTLDHALIDLHGRGGGVLKGGVSLRGARNVGCRRAGGRCDVCCRCSRRSRGVCLDLRRGIDSCGSGLDRFVGARLGFCRAFGRSGRCRRNRRGLMFGRSSGALSARRRERGGVRGLRRHCHRDWSGSDLSNNRCRHAGLSMRCGCDSAVFRAIGGVVRIFRGGRSRRLSRFRCRGGRRCLRGNSRSRRSRGLRCSGLSNHRDRSLSLSRRHDRLRSDRP